MRISIGSGYGVFSISPTHRAALEAYIANQAEHHHIVTFQEEYPRLLQNAASNTMNAMCGIELHFGYISIYDQESNATTRRLSSVYFLPGFVLSAR